MRIPFTGIEIKVDKTPSDNDVRKALAVVNRAGTDRLQAISRSLKDGDELYVGSSAPAMGTVPSPGALPIASLEVEADPLKFQLPWGGNQVLTPRSGYGTPFSTLRGLAAVSPEIFTCIQCRKDQMASLDFDFAPRDKKSKNKEGTQVKINLAREFFAKPDKVTPFKTWLQLLVDEVLTIDALSIYKRRNRAGGIYGYEIIDGSTIKVLLDGSGNIPMPPQVAYRQIIYGAPMAGGDMTREQLMYLPKNVRTWSPYGMSPTEALMLIVTSALNRTIYNLSYYVKGNIPEALVGVPETWSAKQIQQFNEYWNALVKGDPENRAGLRFVPNAMAKDVHEFKTQDFTTTWELWLLKIMCACYGVTPSEIGFTDDVNKATSKTQGDVNQRRGVKPMANFIKGIIDTMLATDLGMPELECVYSGGEGEDAESRSRVEDLQLRSGIKSLDEIRIANGDDALGIGPAVITAMGPVFWQDMALATPNDQLTADETEGKPPVVASTEADTAQQKDLRKYYTIAVKAVQSGRPVREFTSQFIPGRTLKFLHVKLIEATTVEDVQKTFGLVLKAQRLNAIQKKNQKQIASKLTKVFSDMHKGFVKHIEEGTAE